MENQNQNLDEENNEQMIQNEDEEMNEEEGE